MPARFSAYPPDRAVVVRILDDSQRYQVGRTAVCEVQLDHSSVSRMHAEIVQEGGVWRLTDLGSKNGMRVDGRLVSEASLSSPTWFAIGDVYCWLEPMSAQTARDAAAFADVRRSTSRALSQQLQQVHSVDLLLRQVLDAVLELSQLERGFVLYGASPAELHVRATQGMDRTDLSRSSFSGSAGSLERCMAERRSVICCDTSDSPWLGARPSVVLGGIRALVCVPLLLGQEILGAIYADSRSPGPLLTEFDMELVEGVAHQGAAALAAARLRGAVDELRRAANEAGVASLHWNELRPR
ncbi:GAF domain-containing protein [Tahibacter aquaticus]|uniref:GAF domain-containing protein n=1 Tax=Tahibacter aquaticus TaxID=520092 RepID=A0A4R6YWJ5_9GAMM|nr:FHA domain-containing protein [Tahibacter aquaticus]TDR43204.1 GAF domain-containing protein [Tahibacter aquaticus]